MKNSKFKVGQTAYIVANAIYIKEVKIISIRGGFYTLAFTDRSGGMKLKENRLFSTKESAQKYIDTHRLDY